MTPPALAALTGAGPLLDGIAAIAREARRDPAVALNLATARAARGWYRRARREARRWRLAVVAGDAAREREALLLLALTLPPDIVERVERAAAALGVDDEDEA